MRVNQRYRKYHPIVALKVSPRSWWIYAYTAVVEEVIRPFSWERIKEHRYVVVSSVIHVLGLGGWKTY
jgi:hypothetical protein